MLLHSHDSHPADRHIHRDIHGRKPPKTHHRPFAICLNLSVLWVVVSSGALIALFVAVSYVLAQIFTLPPYLLDTSGVGYLSLVEAAREQEWRNYDDFFDQMLN
ncbi:hypothetical protein VTN00DRAFT_6344 [Thermoascus crustaceus]|uniref:uncharacterized protein n=1 Tax=Thermoascus crustaceus TaxID=5088 RepID=UPI003742D18F